MTTTTANVSFATTTPRTIAQGLRRVKKLKGLLAEAQHRASHATSWVSGKTPAFPFEQQRALRATLQDEIVRIESAIAVSNATNSISVEGGAMTLARAIRTLQELKADLAWYASLNLRCGVEETSEYIFDEERQRNVQRKTSVTFESVMDEPARVEIVQRLRDRFEAVNDALESANHRTLIEVEPSAAPSPSGAESTA